MAQAAEDMDFVDNGKVESIEVEVECGERAQVLAGEVDVGFVEDERDCAIEQDPEVGRPLRQMGYLLVLGVHGDLLVQVLGVDVEQLNEPVVVVPLVSGRGTPGRLHGILRIALRLHIGCWLRVQGCGDVPRGGLE